MWILYKNKANNRLRKFAFSEEDDVPHVLLVGNNTWELMDPKLMSKASVDSVAVAKEPEISTTEPKDIINSDISNLENYKLIGIAKLIKDNITGLKLWATYNEEGGQHINLSPSQPMIIPAEGKLQLGTKIGIFVPKD